jgi:dTDP-L-rhamnose 4-epimerase
MGTPTSSRSYTKSFAPGDKILVTGGAGFIGSHTVDLLLERGYRLRILDNLQPRVHPRGKPVWVPAEAEFILGDVSNPSDLARALDGMDGVFHLAAYQDYLPDFSQFIHTNSESAALLFELAVSDRQRFPVRKMVFASSQSVCGEGCYVCTGGEDIGRTVYAARAARKLAHAEAQNSLVSKGHGICVPGPRALEQLRRGKWEIPCPHCGCDMEPVLIEESISTPHTAYAISKYAIELLAERLGHRYGIATACMRYTCVQGPRNSFYNAYSGIARRFAMRILHDMPPVVYEDGGQVRDYVNVRDVARANVIALECDEANSQVLNVGGGRAVTVMEFARIMLDACGSRLEPRVAGDFRLGDTRHTVSDISRMRRLGWEPTAPVEQNVREYLAWLQEQSLSKEYLLEAERVMQEMGVVQTALC